MQRDLERIDRHRQGGFGNSVVWLPQQPTGRSETTERHYLWRSARKLEALATHAARTPLVHQISARLAVPRAGWREAVLRVWRWLPTRYVAERHGDRWQTVSETLSGHAGDCEDWALVAAAVLKAMGIDARMSAMPGHVAVALPVPPEVLAAVRRGMLNWPVVFHAERSWLFIEATLPAFERRRHVPGEHGEPIARWADTPYLQIAGLAEVVPVHSSIAR